MHIIVLENGFGLLFFVNKVIPMQLPIKGVWPVQGQRCATWRSCV